MYCPMRIKWTCGARSKQCNPFGVVDFTKGPVRRIGVVTNVK